MQNETAATPSDEEATPATEGSESASASTDDDTPDEPVQVSSKELAQLKRDAARASSAQRERDILEKRLKRKEARKTSSESEPFSETESAELSRKISQRLFSDPAYAKAVEQNPALKRILLSKNPLVLLDESDFIDVDDAVDQLFDFLDDEVVPTLREDGGKEEEKAPVNEDTNEEKPAAPRPVNSDKATAAPVKTDGEKQAASETELTGTAKAAQMIQSRVRVRE